MPHKGNKPVVYSKSNRESEDVSLDFESDKLSSVQNSFRDCEWILDRRIHSKQEDSDEEGEEEAEEIEEEERVRPLGPLEMFKEKIFIKCAAPMVRYSKLPFRLLCLRWGCNLTFTPMIVCKDFNASQFARDGEFTTNKLDQPLVVQFAANDPFDLASASEKLVGYCDAIDINCGCPQKWVMSDGYGSALLKKPQLISEMVRMTKERSGLPVSVKIRVDDDLKNTLDIIENVQRAGVDWISVHGRTPKQKSTFPVNIDSIKFAKEHATVPIIANGDIFTLKDAINFQNETKVDGVMAARGILQNPALFKGYNSIPMECIKDYLDISMSFGVPFHTIHQHLMFMFFPVHNRVEKSQFNNLKSLAGVLDFFSSKEMEFSPRQEQPQS